MNSLKRKICIFSSTRADYGLLKGLLKEMEERPAIELQLLASGMHLSPEFGTTIREIRADGFNPHETVEILLSGDTPTAVCKSMGLALMGYGEALNRLKPDMVVVLGDRFETFCMAGASQVCRIPVAHIHGGETTEGAFDEAFRHAVTKLSHLHFAGCEAYRKRIIQLGEAPDRVFNVGALGVETLHRTKLLDRRQLGESLDFSLTDPYFLLTFHPVTLEESTAQKQFQAILDAVSGFPDIRVIFTKANADTDGRVINRMMEDYVRQHPRQCLALSSMGSLKYLSALKYTSAVIGNSSSGIIEAPSFKIPTINIGDRQKGRIQADSILNCPPETLAIRDTINIALSQPFQERIKTTENPYDKPGTSSTIATLLEKTDITGILKKKFHDIIDPGRYF
jgi:UDP-hydrolysing UDP-N-acetyl-D-glucosamine 2-epimerase